jgi:hypothetical protein
MDRDHQVQVLSGVSDQGYRWLVEAGGSEDNFSTMLRMFDGDRRVFGGGMGGPKLYPGTVIHESRHRKDDLPYVLVARTAPHIDRVVASTDLGVEIVLPLSEVIGQFGLRFAAAVLPDGHGPGSIRAESQGEVIHTARQWMHRRPASGGAGWLPVDPR